ncbi:hypothetical protein PspMM1_22530 [Pseudoalteromonas sp. MM1]|uniref:hypothetical protein n=1 Tax=Pseudoalteromonas sp. MM1 TaxID=3036714 RepID=UPI0025735BFA|nr:hypothetical protein [Pseudoalteromonas sp. MM1]BED89785.1 hypothetical protein PspMM1_22530 [Pseudoalteromonas sp. MM1]
MSASFKIIFNGQLHQNADISTVQEQLCLFLKIPHNVAVKLFDGRAYALVKDLSSIDAVKTESKLKSFGLITKVEPHASVRAPQSATGTKLVVSPSEPAVKNIDRKLTSIKKSGINSPAALPKLALQSALFFCYSLLFICLICSAVISFNTFKISKIDSSIASPSTTLNYVHYKQYLANQKKHPEVSLPNTHSTDELDQRAQQKIDSYFARFSAHINSYAKILKQPNINSMGAEKLKQHLQEIDALGTEHVFWEQLINLAKSLNSDAHVMSKLTNDNPDKIQWINAVDWISQSYIRQQQNKPDALPASPANTQLAKSPILDLTLLISLMSFLTLIIISIKMKVRSLKMKLTTISTE